MSDKNIELIKAIQRTGVCPTNGKIKVTSQEQEKLSEDKDIFILNEKNRTKPIKINLRKGLLFVGEIIEFGRK